LATTIDGYDVCFDVTQPFPLVNGRPFEIAPAEARMVGQGTLSRSAMHPSNTQIELYTIIYSNGDQLNVEIYPDFCLNPTVYLLSSREVIGLLGNNNGRPDDDLALRDGTFSSEPLDPAYLYGDFASNWRIHSSESLFDRSDASDPLTRIPIARLGTNFESGTVQSEAGDLSEGAGCCAASMDMSMTSVPLILDSFIPGPELLGFEAPPCPGSSYDQLNGSPPFACGSVI
jgi:hypothetical protein